MHCDWLSAAGALSPTQDSRIVSELSLSVPPSLDGVRVDRAVALLADISRSAVDGLIEGGRVGGVGGREGPPPPKPMGQWCSAWCTPTRTSSLWTNLPAWLFTPEPGIEPAPWYTGYFPNAPTWLC